MKLNDCKKEYISPQTVMTQIELESVICASAVIKNDGGQGVAIQDQDINQDFEGYNPTHSNNQNGGWDTIE